MTINTVKTISGCMGKGSMPHNRRSFTAANVDAERTELNEVIIDDNIRERRDLPIRRHPSSSLWKIKDTVLSGIRMDSIMTGLILPMEVLWRLKTMMRYRSGSIKAS